MSSSDIQREWAEDCENNSRKESGLEPKPPQSFRWMTNPVTEAQYQLYKSLRSGPLGS